MSDVLGATYIGRKTVCIDESLDQPATRGRLYFTCAHEAGHWVLHRRMISEVCRGHSAGSQILCRRQDAKKPLEWQADYFAACLLMPADEVKIAFNRLYGPRPIVLYNTQSAFCGPICYDPSVQTWPLIASGLIENGGFSNVSKQAMIIRLQGLGLVRNETRTHLTWETSRGIAYS
jgi:Zn-dependent peptidase ImmA (M78 family)